MNRNKTGTKARHTARTPPSHLYEVIYVDASAERAATLPKPTGRIAYAKGISLEGPYLVPQAGRWIEVSPETAFQRAEGLRRLRTSDPTPAFEHSAS